MSMPENEEQTPAEEPKQELKDIMTTDFMKGIIDDLNLQIDDNEVDDLMNNVPAKGG